MKQTGNIIITGATRGLGFALAERFLEMGYTVWGCGRSQSTESQIQNKWSSAFKLTSVDVANLSQVKSWAQSILSQIGSADLLINNAALMNSQLPLWNILPDEFSSLIDVNIKGIYNTIHAFVPAMVKSSKGVIVNLSSGWGRSTSPLVAPYCASK